MYTVPFHKINPSGNITTLFEGVHFSAAQMQEIAEQAISSRHIGCEQVGFVDVKNGILHMAGGEFCANATRSMALLMAMEQEPPIAPGQEWRGKVFTAGYDEGLTLVVKQPELDAVKQGLEVLLLLPMPTLPPMVELAKGIVLVRMQGIDHLLIDAEIYPFSQNDWKKHAQRFRQQFGLESGPAVGCMWWSPIVGAASQHLLCSVHMHPVVRVLSPFTECYENSCGSGTVALGLWLYKSSGKQQFFMQQPGGYLSLDYRDHATYGTVAVLGGPVHRVASGQAFITKPHVK